MGWNRSTARQARGRCRPGLDTLETRQLLSTLTASPALSSNPDLTASGTVNLDGVIQASAARAAFGVDGTGQSVAVIDTGVDFKNPSLGGSVGPGNKVIAGVDFTGSPNGILPASQHGTGVAGVIASNAAGDLGVAPGAEIVALRVFGDNGQGSFDEVAQALDWVVEHHLQYNITAVNLSVSDGGNYQSNKFASDGSVGQHVTTAIGTLETLDIPVIVAAGNSFDGKSQGGGFPSVVPGAVSVSATDVTGVQPDGSGEKLAADAQRLGSAKGGASVTKLAAPGVGILAPSGDSGTATETGTSFAAPQVAGAIVLLQQEYEKEYHTLPTVAQLEGWLQQGATTIQDPATGIAIGRLNVLHSLQILDAQIHPTPAPVATPAIAPQPKPATIVPIAVVTPKTITSPPASAPTQQQPSKVTKPADTPPVAVPMTEVILNGTSIGSFPTSQLVAQFAGLFSLSKASSSPLRAWAPSGSLPILGASQPSGISVPNPSHPPPTGHSQPQPDEHAKAAPPVVHPISTTVGQARPKPKHKSTFLGLPFFFF